MINYWSRWITGIDIHPGAKIANGILIDHGTGVVIGETAEVGKGCLIYQGVTLGGTGKESGKRHPTLLENVVIGAGSVVMRDVPANCTVVGIPGRVVKNNTTKAVTDDTLLDHSELPDPVAKVFSILVEKVDTLQRELVELSKNQTHKIHIKENVPSEDQEIQDFIHGDGI